MLKELSIEEMKKLANEIGVCCEAKELLLESVNLKEKGEKVKVKERQTRAYHSIIIYRYDKDLYRYYISGEFFLN